MHSHHRILVVDDHPHYRHMLRAFLQQYPEWEVCGEAADGREAVAQTRHLHPDLVLMDLQMPHLDGLEATRRIHALWPATHVLILSMHENPMLPQIARDSGASGYILKSEPLQALSSAIEEIDLRASRIGAVTGR